VGQVFKFVWRLCWKINIVCMSLSPFDSFQSRFVTYLLNCPRSIKYSEHGESLKSRKIAVFTIIVAFMIETGEFTHSFPFSFPFFPLSTEYISQLKFYCNKYCHYFITSSYEKKQNK
jgi:hypothetical protein